MMSDSAPNGAPRVASGSVMRRPDGEPAQLREIRVVGRELAQHLVAHLLDERRPARGDDLLRPRQARVDRRAPAQPALGHRGPGPATRAPTRRSRSWIDEIERGDVRVGRHEQVEQRLGELDDAPRAPVRPASSRRRSSCRRVVIAAARSSDTSTALTLDAATTTSVTVHAASQSPQSAAQRGGGDAAGGDDDRVAALPEEADRQRDDGEGAAERDARSDRDVEGHDDRDRQQPGRQPPRPERRGQRGAHPQLICGQHYVPVRRGDER